MLRSVWYNKLARTLLSTCHPTYLSPELRLAQTLVEADIVVAIYKGYSKGGWDQVLDRTFHSWDDIFTIDNSVNMLSNGCIRSYPIFIHDTNKICLCEKGRLACGTVPKFTDRRYKRYPFLEIWQLFITPPVVRIYIQVIALEDNETCEVIRQ